MSADIVIPTPVWVLEAEEVDIGGLDRFRVRVTVGGHLIWDADYTDDPNDEWFYAPDLETAKTLGHQAFGEWLCRLFDFTEGRLERE